MLASLLLCQLTQALDAMRSHQNLAPITKYYADESGQLTYKQITRLPQTIWAATDSTNFSFGYTRTPYWFRVNISNDTQTAQRLLLEIGRARFDSIEVYLNIDGTMTRYVSGTEYLYKERVMKHRHHLFPIDLQSRQGAEIIIRASNSGSLAFPMTLWQRDRFFDADKNEMLIFGAYFGIWLMVLIYNTVLFAAVSHRALASFVAFVFSFGIYQMASLGLGFGFIWARYPALLDATIVVSIGSATLSLMWFCSHILELGKTNRVGLRILQFFSYPALLCMLAYPFLGYAKIIPVLTALTVPSALIVVFLGIRSSLLGDRPGLYSTIAWTALISGVIARVFAHFDILPMNFLTENAAAVGFLLMIIILSFVIAAEYRRQVKLQQGKILSNNLQFSNEQRRINEQLEGMVQDRTSELETALEELSQANETLKEISTKDSLTGIKNRHYFDTIFEQEWKRASRQNYPLSLLLMDIDFFKRVNDTYGHLAGDECLREVASTINSALKRPADIVARYGGEEFVAVLPYVENENALEFANGIRHRVETSTYIADGHELSVTVSIGVSTVTPTDDDELKDMISAADIALYEAKNSGRNKVCNAGQLTVHSNNAAS
jgi:diguanylate cyclase (GGDEF)-like protein